MRDLSYTMMGMQAALMRQLMQSLEPTGLSIGQPKILAFLKSHEGLCQKDIAAACQIEPGTLTVLLNRMEKQGLLMRCYQNGNRKMRYVYLTDRGRELAVAVVDCFYAVERLAFTDVSEEDRAVFARVCEQIRQNLTGEKQA